VGTQATTHTARGTLTLRGTSKPVDVTVVSTLRNGQVVVAGEIEIVFAEWEIPNPSIPGISTEDRGILEFNLVLRR
jgi:polyisoprenoid-binding protein YceI